MCVGGEGPGAMYSTHSPCASLPSPLRPLPPTLLMVSAITGNSGLPAKKHQRPSDRLSEGGAREGVCEERSLVQNGVSGGSGPWDVCRSEIRLDSFSVLGHLMFYKEKGRGGSQRRKGHHRAHPTLTNDASQEVPGRWTWECPANW